MTMSDTSKMPPDEIPGQDASLGSQEQNGPDLSERESEELLHRLGRGLRAIVGDALIDPLPHRFQHLLDALERAEKPRQI